MKPEAGPLGGAENLMQHIYVYIYIYIYIYTCTHPPEPLYHPHRIPATTVSAGIYVGYCPPPPLPLSNSWIISIVWLCIQDPCFILFWCSRELRHIDGCRTSRTVRRPSRLQGCPAGWKLVGGALYYILPWGYSILCKE